MPAYNYLVFTYQDWARSSVVSNSASAVDAQQVISACITHQKRRLFYFFDIGRFPSDLVDFSIGVEV